MFEFVDGEFDGQCQFNVFVVVQNGGVDVDDLVMFVDQRFVGVVGIDWCVGLQYVEGFVVE